MTERTLRRFVYRFAGRMFDVTLGTTIAPAGLSCGSRRIHSPRERARAGRLTGHGTEGVVIPPGNAALLAARFRGARIERFAGAGHAFPAQQPDAAADLIASQLRPG